jgi:hypothetical protein
MIGGKLRVLVDRAFEVSGNRGIFPFLFFFPEPQSMTG